MRVGADYQPDQDVVIILLSSPEISAAVNLEPKEGELDKFKAVVDLIRERYQERE